MNAKFVLNSKIRLKNNVWLGKILSIDFKEGDYVRSTNKIYFPLGIGRIQKIRDTQCKVQFDPSVFSKPPYRSENKILSLSELEKIYTPLEKMGKGYLDESWKFEMKMTAARLLAANVGGQLSNARTEVLPHQIFTAYNVVSGSIRRFLLADEVGLGKTIEAGIIWQALQQRGLANRTLIVCPAGLTIQWQEEMKDKFGTFFEIFRRDFQANFPRIWDLKHHVIASIDTLKRKEHKDALLENRKWDIIIFDEAQKLSAREYESGKTEKTFNYRLAEDLKNYCDCMLLLSATPHQGEENHSRFKNLLRLLSSDVHFKDIPGCENDGGTIPFYKLVLRTPKKSVTDSKGKKVFKGRQTHRIPFVMFEDERAFYCAVENYIRNGYNILGRITDRKKQLAAGFVLTIFQKMNASSSYAIKNSLQKRKENLLKPLQKQVEEQDEFEDERFEGENEEKELGKNQQFIIENEIQEIDRLLQIPVKKDKKIDVLFQLIKRINKEAPRKEKEKILIFTEYRKTQEYIVNALERTYGKGSTIVIHGGMKLENVLDEKSDIKFLWNRLQEEGAMKASTAKRTSQRLFWDHENVRFLVSTEAGGEGINLQCCHIVINYDSPWNPMRKEQRIGRVYRYGQDKVVQIYNFYNTGTIEERVQTYSEDKIGRVAEAISKITKEDPEEIMATLNGQLENQFNPNTIYSRALVEGTLNNQSQLELTEAIDRAKRAYELAATSLFKNVASYSFDDYQNKLATDLTLNNLEKLTTLFLKKHHRQVQEIDNKVISFIAPDILLPYQINERYTTVTFDRAKAIKRSDLEFFAIGHPFIDAMVDYIGSYDFGGLAAARKIKNDKYKGINGYQFNFIRKKIIPQEVVGDEYLFSFYTTFITDDNQINEDIAEALINTEAIEDGKVNTDSTLSKKINQVKTHMEDKMKLWDWDEEVDVLNVCRIEFV